MEVLPLVTAFDGAGISSTGVKLGTAYQTYSENYDTAVSGYNTAWTTYDSAYQIYESSYDAAVTKYQSEFNDYKQAQSDYESQYESGRLFHKHSDNRHKLRHRPTTLTDKRKLHSRTGSHK